MSNSRPVFTLSTRKLDRDNDRVDVDSLQLEEFLRNNVMLWSHNRDQILGVWEDVRIEDGKLLATPRFASTAMAQEAKTLVEEGIVKAVSIGFRPDPEGTTQNEFGGNDYRNAQVLEASLVAIGANPEALRVKSANTNNAPLAIMRKDFSIMAVKRKTQKNEEPELEKQDDEEEKEATLEDVLAALQSLADRVSALEAAANEDVEAEDDSDSEEKEDEDEEDKDSDEEEKAFALLASILK